MVLKNLNHYLTQIKTNSIITVVLQPCCVCYVGGYMAKKTIRAYVPDELYYALKEKCDKLDITMTDVIISGSVDWLDGPNELVVKDWREVVERFYKQNKQ